MFYLYECPKCKKTVGVTEAVVDYKRVETCKCGEIMRKIFSSSAIKTSDGYKA